MAPARPARVASWRRAAEGAARCGPLRLLTVHARGEFFLSLPPPQVDKSEKFIDELLHTDIRLKCAAVNDPAVDFGARPPVSLSLFLPTPTAHADG